MRKLASSLGGEGLHTKQYIMKGTIGRALYLRQLVVKGGLFLALIFVTHTLQAQIGAKANARDELIKLSLKRSNNPNFLDSIANALAAYNDDEAQARSFFLKGLSSTFKGDIKAATPAYQKALSLIPEGGQYDEMFTHNMVMKNLGISYYRQNLFLQGDSVFISMKDKALARGDSFAYASALSNLGNALNIRQEFASAIEYFKEVIFIEEALGSKGIASSYDKVGTIFGRMEQPREALSWFRKALSKMEAGDLRLEGRLYNNIAVAWRSLANYDSAQFYLIKALRIHEQAGSIIDQAVALENLAKNAMKLVEVDKADSLLKIAYARMPQGKGSRNSSINRLWLLSLEIALHRQDLNEAKKYYQLLEASGIEIQNELDYLKLKARYFEVQGENDSALYYLKIVQAKELELRKSNDAAKIKQEANEVELAEMAVQADLQAKRQRLYLWLAFLGFAALLAYLLFRFTAIGKKGASQKEADFTDNPAGELVRDEFKKMAVDQGEKPEQVLKLKSKALIKVEEILYVQSEGHYVNIHLQNRENPEVERISLNGLLEELGEDGFQRIHRSYAVNIGHLKAVYSNRVLLINNTELPVTRTYSTLLQERFKNLRSSLD